MATLLQRELNKFLNLFEPYAKKYFEKKVKNTKKYSPLISQFYKDLADFSAGGKRMRAFLVWIGYRIGSPPSHKAEVDKQSFSANKILPIALSLEVAHSFLLIHDDIIDRSDVRRGKTTIHRRYEKDFGPHYGESQAIVLGDIACFEALRLVYGSDFSDKQKIEAGNKLLEVLLETGYGEALDIEFSFKKPSFRAICEMTELKTARYTFVGPLLVGVSLGKVSNGQREAIGAFGTNVGLAFQIHDDILGVFGDEKTIGKSILSDMREGKNTTLIYKTREMASNIERQKLAKLWGRDSSTVSDLERTREIIERSGALDWCREENQRLVARAKSYIGGVTSDRDLKLIFSQIADFVASREK